MRSQDKRKTKVYVAMSGGVDSSVAAALLKREGYNVTGVFMRPWQPTVTTSNVVTVDNRLPMSVIHSNVRCQWQKDREDAMRVAVKIGIPLLTWDFSKEYKKEVTDYMIREYKAGRTPNPDVMCNRRIKFGVFLKKALSEGADYIATGHYVRIRPTTNNQRLTIPNKKSKKSSFVSCKLLVGIDKNKDQSYFLWTLTQKQLKYCMFPIGEYTKPEVRKLAEKFSLSTADKKDSQGVCFIGPLDMKEFLKKHIKPKRGEIRFLRPNLKVKGVSRSDLENSSVIGHHDGAFYYTIGQRHGLDIKNGKGPYYVVGKDIKKNIIYVGEEKNLGENEMRIFNSNFINEGLKLPAKISVKIRYRSKSIPVILTQHNSNYCATALLRYQLKAVTPGQSAVFYKDDDLLGGGIIL